jgi:hypothetical protein
MKFYARWASSDPNETTGGVGSDVGRRTKDYEREGRDVVRVSETTVTTLRTRLCAIAERVPTGIAAEIMSVVQEIDRACQIADLISRGR